VALGVLTACRAERQPTALVLRKPFIGRRRRIREGRVAGNWYRGSGVRVAQTGPIKQNFSERIFQTPTRMNTRRPTVPYLLASFLILFFAAALSAQDDMIYWIDNYPEAIQEAKKSGKPLFLEFRCEP
jgi:hypothetical protein